LIVRSAAADGPQRFWLERRPNSGIWAGLYCPPVFADEEALRASLPVPLRARLEALAPVAHSLTHRELRLHPLLLDVAPDAEGLPTGQWVSASALAEHGLPAPVRLMLRTLPG
jgi:A/G-specific adenine glycosylase